MYVCNKISARLQKCSRLFSKGAPRARSWFSCCKRMYHKFPFWGFSVKQSAWGWGRGKFAPGTNIKAVYWGRGCEQAPCRSNNESQCLINSERRCVVYIIHAKILLKYSISRACEYFMQLFINKHLLVQCGGRGADVKQSATIGSGHQGVKASIPAGCCWSTCVLSRHWDNKTFALCQSQSRLRMHSSNITLIVL